MAKKKTCFECGSINDIHAHHVVPRSLGGTKTIPLCGRCHSLAHGTESMFNSDHSNLVRLGLQKAKDAGKRLGRPTIDKNKRDGHLAIRLTIEEKNELKQLAKKSKTSMSELVIAMAEKQIEAIGLRLNID